MKNISGKFTMTHKYVCVPIVHVCRKLYFVRLKCEIGSDVLFTHFVGNAESVKQARAQINIDILHLTFNLGPRFENELCYVKNDECQAGLKCKDVNDGCENSVGRCRKGI